LGRRITAGDAGSERWQSDDAVPGVQESAGLPAVGQGRGVDVFFVLRACFNLESGSMSYVMVIIQGVMIVVIGITGPVVLGNPYFLVSVILGVLLMIWAIGVMRLSNLNVMPDLKDNCVLVTSGPYRVIRHPMYAGGLLITLSLVLNHPTLLRWEYWLVLAVNLHFKLRYEEKLLAGKFPGYSDYKQRTKRLVPFVY
jgi:protein-S-isoprenylcysteine O-methyltransferase Ste14